MAVGGEVLFLGGSDSPLCPPNADCAVGPEPRRDGAAYDVAKDTWRRIADAPVGLQLGAQTAVLARTLYVLLPDPGRNSTRLVSYDLDADAWATLPAPPAGYRSLVATGRDVVAYLGTDEYADAHGDYALDPTSGAWRALPDDPLSPSFDRTMVWTGGRLVLVAPKLVPSPGGADGPSWLRAATYDPSTSTWRALPETKQVISGDLSPVWDGTRLLNPSPGGADGGETNGYGRTLPHGGRLDVETGRWSPLPETTLERRVGRGVTAVSPAYAALGSIVLDVAADRWLALPDRPDAVEQGHAAQWVGSRLVVWGGATYDADGRSTLSAAGSIWTPPRP
ncbi:MAG TPA: hypothetical protein VNA14_03410 [Mycobacteriales bacterium]|nr:hypothetical protein [Mycobacteriales bacterium]